MKKYLVRRHDESLALVGPSSQPPKISGYLAVMEAPEGATHAEDLDIETVEETMLQNVQAKDASGNLIFEEREVTYTDIDGKEVTEMQSFPVWELDASGNPVQESVVISTRQVITVNETKRQARLNAEALKQAEAERIESEKKAKKDQLALTLANLDPATVKLSDLAQLIKDLHGEG